ncbi:complexed with cef1p [Acarospora aff. strigata]|nr:complexed with cef1p [Acarospora aff. strigata]
MTTDPRLIRREEKKLNEGWLIINDYSRHTHNSKQPGQGGAADHEVRDLRAELLKAEAAHYAKTNGVSTTTEVPSERTLPAKRQLQGSASEDGDEGEDPGAKRRRILEETRDIDADSDGAASDSSDEDSDDEEDETAELMRELEKIKKERAEQREREVDCPSRLGSGESDG